MSNHILTAQQFSEQYITELFKTTKAIKKAPDKYREALKHKQVALLFYEPSTRTRFSFESAAQQLGASTMTTENASKFSSAAKGETLEDTARMLNGYANITIVRHSEDDATERMAKVSTIPIINAGSGTKQHPTQALLDLFTIEEEFGRREGLEIAMVGDLLYGRTCASLSYLMAKNKNNTFYFVSPESLKIPSELRNYLQEKSKLNGTKFYETDNLETTLKEVDICYMTRIQKERFGESAHYEEVKDSYILNKEKVALMKETAIIMHPLPRLGELSTEIDGNKRARYFKQAKNGLWVRMAILYLLAEAQ